MYLLFNQNFVGPFLNSLEATSFMEAPIKGPLLEWSQPKNWSVTQQRRNCVRPTLRTRKGVRHACNQFVAASAEKDASKAKTNKIKCAWYYIHRIFLETMANLKKNDAMGMDVALPIW